MKCRTKKSPFPPSLHLTSLSSFGTVLARGAPFAGANPPVKVSPAMPLSVNDHQYKTSWPANTTPQAVDGSGTSPLTLCGYSLANLAAAARFVKFYDKASAPTVGTDVPKRTIELPASAMLAADYVRGKEFKLGLWVSVTTAGVDTDNTAPAANDVLVTIDYQ
jgi:hypothetical protein